MHWQELFGCLSDELSQTNLAPTNVLCKHYLFSLLNLSIVFILIVFIRPKHLASSSSCCKIIQLYCHFNLIYCLRPCPPTVNASLPVLISLFTVFSNNNQTYKLQQEHESYRFFLVVFISNFNTPHLQSSRSLIIWYSLLHNTTKCILFWSKNILPPQMEWFESETACGGASSRCCGWVELTLENCVSQSHSAAASVPVFWSLTPTQHYHPTQRGMLGSQTRKWNFTIFTIIPNQYFISFFALSALPSHTMLPTLIHECILWSN